MQKMLRVALCIIWFAGCLPDSGIIRLKPEIVGLEKPGASEVRGTVPRAILLVHAVERKEIGSDENRTVFYIYDPAVHGQNFRKVFSVPGEGQNVGFITPLFGWCGLVRGIVDSHNPVDLHPPYADIFWYNLLTGEKGNSLRFYTDAVPWSYGSEIRFLSTDARHIYRYDLRKNSLIRYHVDAIKWDDLDGNKVIALLPSLIGRDRIVRIDIGKSEAVVLGSVPKMNRKEWEQTDMRALSNVFPAGPCASDGIFYTLGNSLWWMPPPYEQWYPVIRDAYTDKTCHAVGLFDAAYVGNGRFAVRHSAQDSLYTPEQMRKKEKDNYVLSVIILIDGRTGKILETKSVFEPAFKYRALTYKIPEKWWAEDMKPEKRAPEQYGYFKWDKEKKILCYGSEKMLHVEKDTYMHMSWDGKYMALFRKGICKTETPPSALNFRILNGKTGEDRILEITSDTKTLFISAISWEMLCSGTFDERHLEKFYSPAYKPSRESISDFSTEWFPKIYKSSKICPDQ